MEKTLVVLAAGMGSRFGGLKQVEPVGPNGEFIIDYSVYDAKKAGFTKVIFVIKKENYEVFKDTIGSRLDNIIKVEYVFQEMNFLPKKVDVQRIKPWGTGHALYCVKDYIHEPFAVISADDFYGPHSFEHLSNFIDTNNGIVVIGYELKNVVPENKEIKRGIAITKDDKIIAIKESRVNRKDNLVYCEPINGDKPFTLPLDGRALMAMYAFNQNDFLETLEKMLIDFLNSEDLDTKEFFLPDVVDYYIKQNKVTLVNTDDIWMGITYPEDLMIVKNNIKNYIDNSVYPNNLWGK